jgi:hypothetical protein
MKQKIIITKLNYLKTPIYKWSIINDKGGSFSNSGEYRSLKKCGESLSRYSPETPLEIYTVEGFDANGEWIKVLETSTYLFKQFGKL